MSKKKLIILLIALGVATYAIFCGIVYLCFHRIQSNPIDKIARAYLYEHVVLDEAYGKIEYIGRDIVSGKVITEEVAEIPYILRTDKYLVYCSVSLHSNGSEWVADSYKLKEIRIEETHKLVQSFK